MLKLNKKKLHDKIIWYNYIKSVQNLEKCTINFSYWVEIQIVESKNHVLYKWKINKQI